VLAESLLVKGGLQEVIASIQAGVTLPKSDPGGCIYRVPFAAPFLLTEGSVDSIQGGKTRIYT